ncbi:MAG TPA: hypothetical protein VFQ91_19400 [Bryobacteraceae bacterium]|nr:hypothetical protein [Bryobacteraceae bacterium]
MPTRIAAVLLLFAALLSQAPAAATVAPAPAVAEGHCRARQRADLPVSFARRAAAIIQRPVAYPVQTPPALREGFGRVRFQLPPPGLFV